MVEAAESTSSTETLFFTGGLKFRTCIEFSEMDPLNRPTIARPYTSLATSIASVFVFLV